MAGLSTLRMLLMYVVYYLWIINNFLLKEGGGCIFLGGGVILLVWGGVLRGGIGTIMLLDTFAGNFKLLPNKISDMVFQEDKVENLRKFVEYLTSQIHQAIPGSEVIWYDSVLNTGQLKWQDELNDKNW